MKSINVILVWGRRSVTDHVIVARQSIVRHSVHLCISPSVHVSFSSNCVCVSVGSYTAALRTPKPTFVPFGSSQPLSVPETYLCNRLSSGERRSPGGGSRPSSSHRWTPSPTRGVARSGSPPWTRRSTWRRWWLQWREPPPASASLCLTNRTIVRAHVEAAMQALLELNYHILTIV